MDLILVVAAIVIAVMVFGWLLKVIKATVSTALTIAIVVLVLSLVFGIGPAQVGQQVSNLFHSLWQWLTGNR